ncbi:MAG: endonuclease MutS2 [Oscillospiraceae bacterium]
MNEQYEKSLSKLELDKVLSLLADHASSQAAKDRCMAIRPSADADEIRHLLEETSAACKCITIKGSPSFGGLYDVGASLDRAYRGGCLSPEELLRIAGVLRAARQAKSYAEGEGAQEASVLDLYFQQITSNKYLEERIFNSILSKDEIADAASSELASIRRKIRQQSAKIRESLQKIITSPSYAKILQEPIVTIRSDRFVVPVKAECKGQLPGLVHDVSSSGSTYFIEPMSAVNGNNELRELFMAERKEIERILAELSAESADHREQIKLDYDVLLELECIFARARLSFAMRAICPEVRTDGQLNLIRARHPLITGKTVVPISVRLGSDFDTLIITGPNTGGKTVTLKTIGLLTLMAECGLHIPADDGSSINVYEQVFADIGDEQSIEQSLSTFSSHTKNIVEILKVCDRDSLVLFDELCAGTDPAEGAALAIAIIEFCRNAAPASPPHALRRAQALRHAHERRHERLVRVQRRDPAADLPAAHRRARQVQRVCHLQAPGAGRRHPGAGTEPGQSERRELRGCPDPARSAAAGDGKGEGRSRAPAPRDREAEGKIR